MVLRTLARFNPVKHRLKSVRLSLTINNIDNQIQRTPIVSRTALGRAKLGHITVIMWPSSGYALSQPVTRSAPVSGRAALP